MDYFVLNEEIEYLNERYVVLKIINYRNSNYALASHIVNNTNESDGTFQIFTVENDEEKIVNDLDLANELLKIFKENIKDDIYKGE